MGSKRSRSRGAIGALLVSSALLAAAPAVAEEVIWDTPRHGASGGGSGRAANNDGDCLPAVAEMQDNYRNDVMNARLEVAKASRPFLQDGEGFNKLSCLDNLLNGGLDVVFAPPSLSQLLGMLQNAICSQANQMFSKATAPLNDSLQASLPIGEVLPGVNLGSISGGLNVRARSGNGGLVTTNATSILTGGPTYRRETVVDPRMVDDWGGGLFGN